MLIPELDFITFKPFPRWIIHKIPFSVYTHVAQNGGKTNNQMSGNIFVNGEPVLMASRNRSCLNDAVTIVTTKKKVLSLHDPLLLQDFSLYFLTQLTRFCW